MQNERSYDKHKIAINQNFSRAAHTYDKFSLIQKEVGSRLFERLDLISFSPQYILDLGSGTGHFANMLAHRFPNNQIYNLDLSHAMLKQAKFTHTSKEHHHIVADAEHCPIKNQSIDFIFSNCLLEWTLHPENFFKEIQRVLKPNGLLLFSTFGPDTLYELRESYAALDSENRLNGFLDMHHLGDMLLQAGLKDPVVDSEHITLTYADLKQILYDIKKSGSQYVFKDAPHIPMTKKGLEKLTLAYESFRLTNQRLPLTVEVIYGHAWGSEIGVLSSTDEEGVVRFPLENLKRF